MPRSFLNRCAQRGWVIWPAFVLFLALSCTARASAPSVSTFERPTVLLVLSAPGQEEYASSFSQVAEIWKGNCEQANATLKTIGLDAANTNDLEQVEAWLSEQPQAGAELWVVLHGHGTWDNREAKFNLRGPDLTSTNLSNLLKRFERPLVIVLGFSSSAPFVSKVTGKDRVVMTATRSGSENNYTRFGEQFARFAISKEADLDKDGQTSALEGFLMASRKVSEFYQNAGRLMTEHALLDDNGDGVATPPDFFTGVRATKKPVSGKAVDGSRAHQIHLLPVESERNMPLAWRQKRDGIEFTIEQLRGRKAAMDRELYYKELEAILVELAALYAELPEPSAEEAQK